MSHRNEFETVEEALEWIFFRLNDLDRAGHPLRWDEATRQLFYVVPRTGEEVLICTEICSNCNTPTVRSVGVQEFTGLESAPFTFQAPGTVNAGDLVVMAAEVDDCNLLTPAGNLSVAGGWTEHLATCHDAAVALVHSRFDPTSYDWDWDSVTTHTWVGLSVSISNAGGVGEFASKNSDVDGFSGSSNLPTVTTTLDNSMILYGITSAATDANFGLSVPGLNHIGTQQFSKTTHLLVEVQAVAGPSAQRVVTYSNASFRTEWALVIDPLCLAF